MTSPPDSDNIFQSAQIPNHTAIFATTGSGKSVLVAQKLLDDLSKTPNHLKINFRPNPSP